MSKKHTYKVTVIATTYVEVDGEDEDYAIELAAPKMDISSGNWKAELIGEENE